MCVPSRLRYAAAVALALFLASRQPASAQFGVVFSGAGAENRSMGGASTAAPLDASGALYWNPAAITGLCGSEVGVSLESLYPHARLASSLPANAAGLGVPPVSLAGSDHSDAGIFLLPTVGLVYQAPESNVVWGLGLFSAGGFAVNYPASNTNPILTAQPPRGLGVGALDAQLQVFQVVPTAAVRLTDHLSVGVAPTLSLATLTADPAFLAAPDDANGDHFRTFEPATHGRTRAGGGFQAGVFYTTESAWNFGFSFKSPQWFETFSYNATDELGRPRPLSVRFDYPMIASLGTSYTGFEHLTLAADFRYIDYHNTAGFSHTGFDPGTGAVRGLGWNSIFAMALGAQYELSNTTSVRIGYTYNTNPIPDDRTSFNVGSPLILEHAIYVGATWKVTESFRLSVAYAHGFDNSIQGPIVSPLGPIPGSAVQSTVSADTFVFGATFRF
jgi:long-chain fatty acid transport protein